MNAKEAHQHMRRKALGCPCCGAALALTAGRCEEPDNSEVNVVAWVFMQTASQLRELDAIALNPIEDIADLIVSGDVLVGEGTR